MTFIKYVKEFSFTRKPFVLFFCLAVILWCWAFRGFLFGDLNFSSDAISYYENTKYFVDNIMRGQYPLWNPLWWNGFSNEFFLRRIGAFNPFLVVIIFLRMLGLPHMQAYLFYLVFYYFLGMGGFYLLTKRLLQDEQVAFAAFLILSFSALGTRLFDSYFHLVVVPLIWFFYFIVAFYQEQRAHHAMGLTLALVNLATTYIPFYFLTIFLSFLMCWAMFFSGQILVFLKRAWAFIPRHKIVVVLCLIALGLSLIPGLMFYQSVKREEIVMPHRNFNFPFSPAPSSSQLEVDVENVTTWAIMEDLAFSASFRDLRLFRIAMMYVPLWALLILFLGLFVRTNRRLLMLFFWALILFLIGSPYKVPIYHFLRSHVFYFKYFRNLHFFLWFAILPIFVFYVSELFQKLLGQKAQGKERAWLYSLLWLTHAGFVFYLFWQGKALVSSFIVVLLSVLFFSLYFFVPAFVNHRMVSTLLVFCAVTVQPLEVFNYLNRSYEDKKGLFLFDYQYSDIHFIQELRGGGRAHELSPNVLNIDDASYYMGKKVPDIYVASKWFNLFYDNIHKAVTAEYRRPLFVVYDQIEWMGNEAVDFKRVERHLLENRNLAFVSPSSGQNRNEMDLRGDDPRPDLKALRVQRGMDDVRVIDFNINSIKLKTAFPYRKFLVYNETYHQNWLAFIDGHPVDIYRANIAFKGIWVPPGEHSIYFRYGKWQVHFFNWCLNIFYLFFFIAFVLEAAKKKGHNGHGEGPHHD